MEKQRKYWPPREGANIFSEPHLELGKYMGDWEKLAIGNHTRKVVKAASGSTPAGLIKLICDSSVM